MGRLFGLILLVLAVWVGVEVYEKGVDHAFGGVFAWMGSPLQSEYEQGSRVEPSGREVQSGSIAQKMGAKVQSDIDAGARRDGASDEEDND